MYNIIFKNYAFLDRRECEIDLQEEVSFGYGYQWQLLRKIQLCIFLHSQVKEIESYTQLTLEISESKRI